MGVCRACPSPAIVDVSDLGVSIGRGYAALRPSFPAVVGCHGGADEQRFGVWPIAASKKSFVFLGTYLPS